MLSRKGRAESVKPEEMQAEEVVGVGPRLDRVPAARAGEILKLGDRVFVRVLGVDALAASEGERAAEHMHALLGEAHEINLDTPGLSVPHRVMGEAGEIECALKLAIDAGQQIEIEGGGDALAHRHRPARGWKPAS